MRWPLKNQILVRMFLLLLVTIGAITFANIRSSIVANRKTEIGRLQRLEKLVTTSRFPLTSPVLENMKLLSEAEFVLAGSERKIISKTSTAPDLRTLPRPPNVDAQAFQVTAILSDGQSYYHTSVPNIQNNRRAPTAGELHIFVPRQSNLALWWQASKSPLTIAMLVLPLAFLVSAAVATQVTRPLAMLETQVKQIAQGDIHQIPQVQGNNEIQDLNSSINEMAVKLQDHDSQLRKNERLRTMVQFGSSIAHHLRNSATGCKMAIELLGVDHQEIQESDNYVVAIRQLGLMDNYIKRFLLLSKSPESKHEVEAPAIDFSQVLENVVFLLSPSAKHLNVDMTVDADDSTSTFKMNEEDAEQLMMNLIANGITAASQAVHHKQTGNSTVSQNATIAISLVTNTEGVTFSVTDSGDGPADDIADSIFQPFVTGRKEGTGLGLSLVREISNRAGGEIQWRRENNKTIFVFKAQHKTNKSVSPQ